MKLKKLPLVEAMESCTHTVLRHSSIERNGHLLVQTLYSDSFQLLRCIISVCRLICKLIAAQNQEFQRPGLFSFHPHFSLQFLELLCVHSSELVQMGRGDREPCASFSAAPPMFSNRIIEPSHKTIDKIISRN